MLLVTTLVPALAACPKSKSEVEKEVGEGGAAAVSSIAPRTSASAPVLFDVCAAIPVADVAKATNIAVTLTEVPTGGSTPECIYKTANGRTPRFVIEKSLMTISGAKQLWKGGKDVPGVGDAAYLAPGATELDVQKGSTVIRVGYEPANPKAGEDERLPILKKLVDLALPVLAK